MTEEALIRAAIDNFIQAYNRADLEGLLACYGHDLIKMRAGAANENRSHVAARVAQVFNQFDTQVEVTIDELAVSGDHAFTRGTFIVSLTPKSGGDMHQVERRYLELWRKDGDRWLVIRTMDNSSS